ncbi:hypothetical protein [Sediminicola luteus]|uniref:DUF1963 domain-containing protein n=1 Tax=Sediminicola luteus TaxID=319238 RepID=A0A2A4GBL4_9FLAO|nr:hypothetical protein [Sediminicola luteus]PCE65987.1 hypothetical protein B7P33_01410 [Sediminicola luteus]
MTIPEIKLIPKPESEEGRQALGYKWNNIAGTRHKLGGKPDGLPVQEYPLCDSCKSTMTFYAQIDSIGDDYDLADCMLIHSFVCFDCYEVKSQLTQSLV